MNKETKNTQLNMLDSISTIRINEDDKCSVNSSNSSSRRILSSGSSINNALDETDPTSVANINANKNRYIIVEDITDKKKKDDQANGNSKYMENESDYNFEYNE